VPFIILFALFLYEGIGQKTQFQELKKSVQTKTEKVGNIPFYHNKQTDLLLPLHLNMQAEVMTAPASWYHQPNTQMLDDLTFMRECKRKRHETAHSTPAHDAWFLLPPQLKRARPAPCQALVIYQPADQLIKESIERQQHFTTEDLF
jgi:hypothetical protein